jgi:hypothetical protein
MLFVYQTWQISYEVCLVVPRVSWGLEEGGGGNFLWPNGQSYPGSAPLAPGPIDTLFPAPLEDPLSLFTPFEGGPPVYLSWQPPMTFILCAEKGVRPYGVVLWLLCV